MNRDDKIASSPVTSATLLVGLRDPENDQSWREFYRLYHCLIIGYARRQGCSAEMCREIFQEIMITLMRVMPRFEYDRSKGRFRFYLCRLVRTSLLGAFRRQRKYLQPGASGDSHTANFFERIADENAAVAGAEWDRQWELNLLAQALERVRLKISPSTYRAFTLYVLEERPVAEICREMQLTPNALYQQRNRVTDLLRREMILLRTELGEVEV